MKLVLSHFIPLLALVTCLHTESYAQKPDINFGEISKEELEMTTYPLDSGASAIILYDEGSARFDVLQHDGSYILFNRHLRIKIIDKTGYDWANFEIPLNSGNTTQQKEQLVRLKAYTFNLDEKGKIVETKLSKRSTLTEKVSDKLRIEKITMPAVKEGSVIDIE